MPPRQYLVVAGTDADDDRTICDAGETCGAWPTIGAPTPLLVLGDTNPGKLDLGVGFDVSLGAGRTSTDAPHGGIRRLEPAKVVTPPR